MPATIVPFPSSASASAASSSTHSASSAGTLSTIATPTPHAAHIHAPLLTARSRRPSSPTPRPAPTSRRSPTPEPPSLGTKERDRPPQPKRDRNGSLSSDHERDRSNSGSTRHRPRSSSFSGTINAASGLWHGSTRSGTTGLGSGLRNWLPSAASATGFVKRKGSLTQAPSTPTTPTFAAYLQAATGGPATTPAGGGGIPPAGKESGGTASRKDILVNSRGAAPSPTRALSSPAPPSTPLVAMVSTQPALPHHSSSSSVLTSSATQSGDRNGVNGGSTTRSPYRTAHSSTTTLPYHSSHFQTPVPSPGPMHHSQIPPSHSSSTLGSGGSHAGSHVGHGGPGQASLRSFASFEHRNAAAMALDRSSGELGQPDDVWQSVCARTLPLFNGEGCKGIIEDLNEQVSHHVKRAIDRLSASSVSHKLTSDLSDLITIGLLSLSTRLASLSDRDLLPSLLEAWQTFLTNILPYLQAIFLPLRTDRHLITIVSTASAASSDNVHVKAHPTFVNASTTSLLSTATGTTIHPETATITPAAAKRRADRRRGLDVRRIALLAFRDSVVIPIAPRLDSVLTDLYLSRPASPPSPTLHPSSAWGRSGTPTDSPSRRRSLHASPRIHARPRTAEKGAPGPFGAGGVSGTRDGILANSAGMASTGTGSGAGSGVSHAQRLQMFAILGSLQTGDENQYFVDGMTRTVRMGSERRGSVNSSAGHATGAGVGLGVGSPHVQGLGVDGMSGDRKPDGTWSAVAGRGGATDESDDPQQQKRREPVLQGRGRVRARVHVPTGGIGQVVSMGQV